METALAPESEQDAGSRLPFQVLILYDEAASGRYAMDLYQSLQQNLDRSFDLKLKLWNFPVLSVPRIRALVAENISEADLIILAINDASGMADDVKQWLSAWLLEQPESNPGAVVLLRRNRRPHGLAPSVPDELLDAIREHQIKVFAKDIEPDAPAPAGWNSLIELHDRATRHSSVLDGILARDTFPHWGINE